MPLPTVSILIPTHNRQRSLNDCIAACKRLQYPQDLVEIVVIDDGSTPPVVLADGVRLFRQDQRGPAAARNAAIAKASGEFLVFTDDDCEPSPAWLQELIEIYLENPSAMIGGVTVNGLPDNAFASASQCLVDYVYIFFSARADSFQFFTSNNMGGAASELRRLGGFDESFPLPAAEDRDLCERWGLLRLAPKAIVIHRHPLTLSRYWHQHLRYGRGAATLFQRRSHRGTNRRLLRNHFYVGLLNAPFQNSAVNRPWAVLALLLLSQIANACGFAYEASWAAFRRRRSESSPPDTPA